MVRIPEAVRQLIASGPNAHLTTLNADGSPQITVVWVGIEDDEFVMAHRGVWQKVKNIRRDPQGGPVMPRPRKKPARTARVSGGLRRGARGGRRCCRPAPTTGTDLYRPRRRVRISARPGNRTLRLYHPHHPEALFRRRAVESVRNACRPSAWTNLRIVPKLAL